MSPENIGRPIYIYIGTWRPNISQKHSLSHPTKARGDNLVLYVLKGPLVWNTMNELIHFCSKDSCFQLNYVFKETLWKARLNEPFFVISLHVMVLTRLLYAVSQWCSFGLFSGVQNINPKATIFLNGVYASYKELIVTVFFIYLKYTQYLIK